MPELTPVESSGKRQAIPNSMSIESADCTPESEAPAGHDAPAIRVERLSKTFRIWTSPSARLKALLLRPVWELGSKWRSTRRAAHTLRQWSSRYYRDFHALRNVSFKVCRGECIGVIGYNGSGKSTLLQIIAGTLTPTSGKVTANGRVTALLELGSGFNPDFTGRENVFLYGAILGFSREEIQTRLPAIEAFAEIGDFIDQPVKTYSSGMSVRLAFSVVTQLDPDIIIIDEALSVGDAYFQHKSMQHSRRFRDEGKSILLVSHDTGTIKTMCDRALILDRGMILREGPADAVCDFYNALIAKREYDAEIRQIERERGRIVTRSGDMSAVIGSIDLLDSRGEAARAFCPGDLLRISCVVEFRRALQDPTVGILIRDRLGNDVFGTNTFFLGKQTGSFHEAERAEFLFELRLNLGTGSYSLTAAVHVGPRHTIANHDWQDNALVFEVLPGSGPQTIGCAHLPVAVEVHRGALQHKRGYAWGTLIGFDLDGNAARYKEYGWAAPEPHFTWTAGREAALVFDLESSEEPREVHATLSALTAPDLPVQRVTVKFDGEPLETWQVDGQQRIYRTTIPKTLLRQPGRHRLSFLTPDAISPSKAGSADPRTLGLCFRSLGLS